MWLCVELTGGRLVMANSGCHLDFIWNQLEHKQLGMDEEIFLIWSLEVRRSTVNLGHNFWWQSGRICPRKQGHQTCSVDSFQRFWSPHWIHPLKLRKSCSRWIPEQTGVSSRRTEPTWAERQVHFGTVGHCDISSDSLSFLWWPTQSELSLAPSPILYHECETAKVSRSAGTLRWQTGSGEYSYFLFRRWPTKVLLFIMNWMMMPT